MAVLGYNSLCSQVFFSLDVRPWLYARTSMEFVVGNYVDMCLKAVGRPIKCVYISDFPFLDCIAKRNIINCHYVTQNGDSVTN